MLTCHAALPPWSIEDIIDDIDADEEYDGPHAEDSNVGSIGDENDNDDDNHVARPDEGGDAYVDPVMNFFQ